MGKALKDECGGIFAKSKTAATN